MLTFKDLIKIPPNNGVKYEIQTQDSRRPLKHSHVEFPWSVTEREFNYLYELIVAGEYRSAFEVSTGTCVSTIAIACGMEVNGGRLISMDSYIEELSNNNLAYLNASKTLNDDSLSFQFNQHVIKNLELTNWVELVIGWSPEDISDFVLPGLDFVFIDAGHTDDHLIADFCAVEPFLAERCTLVLHDMHCFSGKSLSVIEKFFGTDIVQPNLLSYQSGEAYGIGVISK